MARPTLESFRKAAFKKRGVKEEYIELSAAYDIRKKLNTTHEPKRMFSVISSSTQPQHLELLREWCLAEWGKVDSFDCSDNGIAVPVPLVAVLDQELIGGLAFTSYPVPGNTHLGVWINALIDSYSRAPG
jgi:hypothetical protein